MGAGREVGLAHIPKERWWGGDRARHPRHPPVRVASAGGGGAHLAVEGALWRFAGGGSEKGTPTRFVTPPGRGGADPALVPGSGTPARGAIVAPKSPKLGPFREKTGGKGPRRASLHW